MEGNSAFPKGKDGAYNPFSAQKGGGEGGWGTDDFVRELTGIPDLAGKGQY